MCNFVGETEWHLLSHMHFAGAFALCAKSCWNWPNCSWITFNWQWGVTPAKRMIWNLFLFSEVMQNRCFSIFGWKEKGKKERFFPRNWHSLGSGYFGRKQVCRMELLWDSNVYINQGFKTQIPDGPKNIFVVSEVMIRFCSFKVFLSNRQAKCAKFWVGLAGQN